MRKVTSSTIEDELGGLFETCQKATSMWTALQEIVHPQPPTSVVTINSAANIIVNGTAKHKISRAIDMIFYLVRNRVRQNYFHIFWEEGNIFLSDHFI